MGFQFEPTNTRRESDSSWETYDESDVEDEETINDMDRTEEFTWCLC